MSERKKILFPVLYPPERVPSQRFRFEQYLAFLQSNGYDCKVSSILSKPDHVRFYRKGAFFAKALVVIKGFFKRLRDLFLIRRYDLIFVHRESYILGSSFFERVFSWSKVPMIYDFDDAIWLHNVSVANKRFNWLKDPSKTRRIASLADLVIAGNHFLKSYAEQFTPNVRIIPTTIDTAEYDPERIPDRENDAVVIGWSGSITTIEHFRWLRSALLRLKKVHGDAVRFRVIGDPDFFDEELDVRGIEWRREEELEEIGNFDIGIMPLPDTEWAKGKCALKALQYMAMEVPPVVSPVGVNEEIVKNGVNGYTANKEEEWVDILERLIQDAKLRKRLGMAARRTVKEYYSVEVNKEHYIQALEDALA